MGFDAENNNPPGARIKVFGIGGGGGNAVNTMIRANLEGVEFITANTDVQALRFSLAQNNIQIGKELTKGLGAGADPDVGRDAAIEDRQEIEGVIKDADMVFITAGMGGGTGTGGAAVIAQIARELGALTVAVVTKPFNFEGRRRRKHAELGIARLRECVDTLITIPNQRLLEIATPDLSMIDAFKMADNVLVNAVRGISDIINIPGTVNVDFADVKTVMSNMGHSLMGIGHAAGTNRAAEAARMAISSPLLEDIDIQGATGILINITAGSSITLMEVNEACSIIQDSAHEDANIIFGAVIDENLGEAIRVTVIATGFPVDSDTLDKAAGPTIVKPFEKSIYSPDYATGNGIASIPKIVTPDLRVASQSSPAPLEPTVETNMSPLSNEAQELAKWTIGQMEESVDPASQDDLQNHVTGDTSETEPRNLEITAVELSDDLDDSFVASVAGENNDAWPEFESVASPYEAADKANSSVLDPVEPEVVPPQNVDIGVPSVSPGTSDCGNTAARIFDENFDGIDIQDAGPTGDAPIESFFNESGNLDITNEIDRKIDEALALAQRLRSAGATAKATQSGATGTDDGILEDAELPAFMRSGNSDISLD